MVPAEHKRKENISEYVLYMLHAQDIIREADFNEDKIGDYVAQHVSGNDEEKVAILNWYTDLAGKMEAEGRKDEGNIRIVEENIAYLADLNKELLRSDQEYRRTYDQAKLHINRRMSELNGTAKDPIAVSLLSVYEVNRMRQKGEQPHEDLANAVFSFQNILSYLSHRHRQRNK